MKYNEIKTFLKNVYVKRLEFKDHAPAVLLVGSTATAKSALVHELGNELGVPVIQIRTALSEPSDLTGIPRPDKTGLETVWLKPDWFPYSQDAWEKINPEVKDAAIKIVDGIKKNGPNGLIFFDEANRGPLETIQAVFQILSDYKIHCHELPKGYIIIGAINPSSLYQTTDVDKAFWARWVQIKMEFDQQQALTYAVEQNYTSNMIQFLSANPHLLSVQEDFELETFYNWRGWNFFAELIKLNCIPKDAEVEICAGCVGKEAAMAWVRFNDKAYQRPVPGIDVLTKYDEVKAKIKEAAVDSLVFTTNEIVAYLNSTKSKPVYIKNLKLFLKDVKPEVRITLLKQLNTNCLGKLSEDPEISNIVSNDLKSIGR